MATIGELFALSLQYPLISIIIAAVLFFFGLKVASTILKIIFWVLAAVAIVAAIYFLFMG